MNEFKKAFPVTIPVMAGYLFLGITYGILMVTSGFPAWLPVLTAAVIYTGSMEFLMVEILSSSFHPLAAFLTAFMVGSRHLFYGLSMLKKYHGCGPVKFYLIYTCSDETFALNYNADLSHVNKGRYYFFVSLLDQLYWIAGALIGSICGTLITFNTKGLDFVMTAMFLCIFADQWLKDEAAASGKMQGIASPAREEKAAVLSSNKEKQGLHTAILRIRVHLPELLGFLASLVCLLLFGPDRFIVPAMILILILCIALRPFIEGGKK